MVLELHFPDPRSGVSIHGMSVGADVAEIGSPFPGGELSDADCRTDARPRRVCPEDASGGGVKGINRAADAPDKHAPAGDSRLRESHRVPWKSESPFQLEASDVGGGQPRLRLVVRIVQIEAPSIPVAFSECERLRRGGAAAAHGFNGGCCELLAGNVSGNCTAFLLAQACCLNQHRALEHHLEHGFGLPVGKLGMRRHARLRRAIVAGGTARLVERGAIRGSAPKRHGKCSEHNREACHGSWPM